MDNSPIFIMSSERSGSNLLRILLGNHSNICGPPAPQLLQTFYSQIPYYSPLSHRENLKNLFEDFRAIVNHPYHSWNILFDFDYIFDKYRPKSFLDLFHVFYNEYSIKENKRRYVCKENNIFDYACQLVNYYENPRFIYLCRDPRDYVASWIKLPVEPNTVFAAAQRWVEEQRKCHILLSSFGLEAFKIRYEDLITDTKQTMTMLFSFLGESVEEGCFEIKENNNSAITWNSFWKNLNKPIDSRNFKKYLTAFNHDAIRMIESLAKEYMIRLNYDFDTDLNWKKSKLFKYRQAILSKYYKVKNRKKHHETIRVLNSRLSLANSIAIKRKKSMLKNSFPSLDN
jgi:hypothetical protein